MLYVNTEKVQLKMAERRETMTSLRKRAGLADKTMTKIMRGDNVTPATVGKLASVLGLSTREIIISKPVSVTKVSKKDKEQSRLLSMLDKAKGCIAKGELVAAQNQAADVYNHISDIINSRKAQG